MSALCPHTGLQILSPPPSPQPQLKLAAPARVFSPQQQQQPRSADEPVPRGSKLTRSRSAAGTSTSMQQRRMQLQQQQQQIQKQQHSQIQQQQQQQVPPRTCRASSVGVGFSQQQHQGLTRPWTVVNPTAAVYHQQIHVAASPPATVSAVFPTARQAEVVSPPPPLQPPAQARTSLSSTVPAILRLEECLSSYEREST